MHPLYDMKDQRFLKSYGDILIGDDNWFASDCRVLHSVKTPERCIFALGSFVTHGHDFESYSVHGGQPLRVIRRNVKLDYNHYMVEDYS